MIARPTTMRFGMVLQLPQSAQWVVLIPVIQNSTFMFLSGSPVTPMRRAFSPLSQNKGGGNPLYSFQGGTK